MGWSAGRHVDHPGTPLVPNAGPGTRWETNSIRAGRSRALHGSKIFFAKPGLGGLEECSWDASGLQFCIGRTSVCDEGGVKWPIPLGTKRGFRADFSAHFSCPKKSHQIHATQIPKIRANFETSFPMHGVSGCSTLVCVTDAGCQYFYADQPSLASYPFLKRRCLVNLKGQKFKFKIC